MSCVFRILATNVDVKNLIKLWIIRQYEFLRKGRFESGRNAWKPLFCCRKLDIVNRLIFVYWIREPNADWYSNFSVCYGKYLAHYQF